MHLINKFANTAFGTHATGSKITFQILNDILVQGETSLDGRNGIFLMTSDANGQLIKTNTRYNVFATSTESFDNTVTNFAQTGITFDDSLHNTLDNIINKQEILIP